MPPARMMSERMLMSGPVHCDQKLYAIIRCICDLLAAAMAAVMLQVIGGSPCKYEAARHQQSAQCPSCQKFGSQASRAIHVRTHILSHQARLYNISARVYMYCEDDVSNR